MKQLSRRAIGRRDWRFGTPSVPGTLPRTRDMSPPTWLWRLTPFFRGSLSLRWRGGGGVGRDGMRMLGRVWNKNGEYSKYQARENISTFNLHQHLHLHNRKLRTTPQSTYQKMSSCAFLLQPFISNFFVSNFEKRKLKNRMYAFLPRSILNQHVIKLRGVLSQKLRKNLCLSVQFLPRRNSIREKSVMEPTLYSFVLGAIP